MSSFSSAKTLFLCLLSMLSFQYGFTQIYVKADATGQNNGTTWQDAFTDLQAALSASNEGDIIWVAAGTYLPGKKGDPETATFLLTKDIQLYGGFAGVEKSLSERDLSNHPTILSGDLNQDDIAGDFKSNRTDNVWNIMLVKNETASVPIIDGFIFEGGQADGEINFGYESRGGGLFIYGPVNLRNCQFKNNYAKRDGGAVFFWDSLLVDKIKIPNNDFNMVVDSCRFENNFAENSGGAMCQVLIKNNVSHAYIGHSVFYNNKNIGTGGAIEFYNKTANSNIEVEDCVFKKNVAELGGAVIAISRALNITTSFSNCYFSENTAVDKFPKKIATGGGALRFAFLPGAEASLGRVKGCTFSKNVTELYGGGVSIKSVKSAKNNSVVIDSCFFEKNSADGGGAVALLCQGLSDSINIDRSQFLENSVSEINPDFYTGGGAVLLAYWQAGKESKANIKACTFKNNTTKHGGGGAIGIKPLSRSNFTSIYDCTFNGNFAVGKGAAMLYDGVAGNYEINACTFTNNLAEDRGDMVYEEKAVDRTFFFLFYHGALWIQILYSLLMFFISRERTTFYYVLLGLGLSVFAFFINDVHRFSFDFNAAFSQTGIIAAARLGILLIIISAVKFAQYYLNVDHYFSNFKRLAKYFVSLILFFEVLNFMIFTGLWEPGSVLFDLIMGGVNFLTAIGFVIPVLLAVAVLFKGYKLALYLLPAFLFAGIAGMYGFFSFFFSSTPDPTNLFSSVMILLALISIGLANGYRINLLKKEKARAEKLTELDMAKTRLYTNITHEFRTPLTVIMGASEMVKGNESEKKLIRRNSQQLLQLINQMLDLSKLDAGALRLTLKQGDIIPFIEYLIESFQSLAVAKHIQLTFYREVEELNMDYDAEKIQAIVTNLVSNAIKFTPESGKVVVHVKEESIQQQSHLVLSVRDNGHGIPEQELPHIFDRFHQVDSTDVRQSEGTGIGLALVKELVKLMNGSVEVTSKVDRGSVFKIQLPVTRNAPLQTDVIQHAEMVTPLESLEEEIAPSFRPITDDLPLALIIEDNRDVVRFLRSCLQQKYRLEVAYNGKTGIEKALEIVPDIIISDVMMPEADGYTVCRTLKNDERTSHVPIIILTAKATQQDKMEGLDVGADAYLSKPFHREELELRLQKLVELRRRLQERYQSLLHAPQKSVEAEDPFIQKLRAVVEENLDDESFGIADLCQAVTLSRMQVHRKLKALVDMPATQFIHSIRLQKAYQLLQDSDLNVSEVAYQVGFSDHSYFTRLFRKRFGKRPSEVRVK